MHPDVLNEFYGVHGQPAQRGAGQSGAGLSPDDVEEVENEDNDNAWEGIKDWVADEHEHNFHHKPVAVPRSHMPFTSDAAKNLFANVLDQLHQTGALPQGYGILPNEWGPNGYPTIEYIPTSRRGRKSLEITLADCIWRPRAGLWVQGLFVLNRVLFEQESGNV